MKNFENIHIGALIKKRKDELNIDQLRIRNFLKTDEKEIEKMYMARSLDTEIVLRWSKLLEYDFFRIYSQHLILYAPCASHHQKSNQKKISTLPHFRKNIYTVEIIDFILELIKTGNKTIKEVNEEYRIPKTTLHKWVNKYKDRK